MAYTINHYITDWVEESRALMQPDKVLWIDGTETQLEELRREAYITGELIKLNQEKLPGCVYHRSALNDVARVEGRTFICCKKEEDAGPTNNVDEDVHDNQGEWIADTDPTDGDSFFRIEAVSNREATAEVWVDSSASRRYSLERTTNLAFPDWQPVAGQTDLPGLDGLRSLVETNPAEPHHYRVGVQVP